MHSTLSTVPIDKTSHGVWLETEIHSHLDFFALLKLHRRYANRHKRDETIRVSDPACWMSEIHVIGKKQVVSLSYQPVSGRYERRYIINSRIGSQRNFMEVLVNTISSAVSTLIELIPRPVRVFGGKFVEAVSFIKNKIFGESSPDAPPSTSLQQRAASTSSLTDTLKILRDEDQNLDAAATDDPGSPPKHPGDTNIGVIGSDGTCKSSLINALRNVGDEDQHLGAAVTGLFTKQQTVTERYQLDGSKFLCELPSRGIKNPDKLASRSGLDHYDALVIAHTALTISEEILQLTKRAIAKGIPVYVVRPAFDQTVRNNYREGSAKEFREESIEALCERTKAEIVRSFGSLIDAKHVYLCSNFDRELYELKDLKRSLLQVEKRPVSEQQ